ncbi:MAG: hypothetical protein DRP63_06330 [Planctomycetota bacterium]|nr:MAG: hypothetical protein DRP63_06330 [Planctomycetota bacterium]
MAPFFWLAVEAFLKRFNFWILVGVCAAFIVLAYFYDLFGFGEPSTLFAETYAAIALLYVLVAPLFCAADVLEWERRAGASDLLVVRPTRAIAQVAGRVLGIVIGSLIGLAILAAVFHITALLGDAFVPKAAYSVVLPCSAVLFTTASLVQLSAPRAGFVTTAAILFLLFSASNMLAFSESTLAKRLAGIIPNFHIANLQAMIAANLSPPTAMLLFCLLHHLLYGLFLCAVAVGLLRRLNEPAKKR